MSGFPCAFAVVPETAIHAIAVAKTTAIACAAVLFIVSSLSQTRKFHAIFRSIVLCIVIALFLTRSALLLRNIALILPLGARGPSWMFVILVFFFLKGVIALWLIRIAFSVNPHASSELLFLLGLTASDRLPSTIRDCSAPNVLGSNHDGHWDEVANGPGTTHRHFHAIRGVRESIHIP